MIPDWQLPPGVDRGLNDYFKSAEMVAGYDAQMAASPLAATDVRFCEQHFKPGKLLDLGCGTGRLCHHFARRGFECVGVDLSEEMLATARATPSSVTWLKANIVDLGELESGSFANVACLFSTLGMVRGDEHRQAVVANAYRLLKPGGTFVLHVHNRGFAGLGLKRFLTGDFTMPQAYGGAALTIHHFSKTEITSLLKREGFAIRDVQVLTPDDTPAKFPWRVYGYLLAAGRVQ